ncbi:hypothetical protein LGQ02_04705 [Bacillus shivajii]|uniref:hypothetical protein n=1 Tax=Bacillus shivajii TaxID=1983719 RepID=UPI001CFAE73A|nr:hypothetical protein [Bacillus shivajii]UCZ54086.1 hypothetical protein LGQ02_04705 [Bacillus shivajii]
MKKRIFLLTIIFTLLFSLRGFAHVENEATIYDDIELSDAKEEIVILRALNVIPFESGANLYRPQEILTRADLAHWAASFKGLEVEGHSDDQSHDGHGHSHGSSQSPEEYQQLALEEGLVEDLDGNATYEDIARAYFGDADVELDEIGEEVTREDFAIFMGEFFDEEVNGGTLFYAADFIEGPVGKIEAVEADRVGEAESAYDRFRITVDGKDYQIHHHPKVFNGAVDARAWEGRYLVQSWYSDEEEGLEILLIDDEMAADDIVDDESGDNTEEGELEQVASDITEEQPSEENVDEEEESADFPMFIVIIGALLAVVLGWLFMKKK